MTPATALGARALDVWLAELRLSPAEAAERDGVVSRDIVVDGRRRGGIRITLILAPDVGLVAWVHYAPPLADGFRKTYQQLLKWNDELPFVKFALADDERVVLSAELPAAGLDRDSVGRTVARLVAVCDLLAEPSARWLERGPSPPRTPEPGVVRPHALLDRYAADLAELAPTEEAP